ncbi:MAG: DUF6273 domain-containing protein [Treponema sp.]|jgi:hypothetical protein|nr:DUF6273 domain-containing protein [Treponema sp.]
MSDLKWDCSCGNAGNNGKFCTACGKAAALTPDKAGTLPKNAEIIKFGTFDWLVLQRKGNSALLITKGIVEMGPYHTEMKGTTWENSSIRKYLNGKFLEKFSPQERERIVEVTNQNPDNPWYNALGTNFEGKEKGLARVQKGGNPTNDKIFLLSIEEVCTLFGDSTARLRNKGFTQNGVNFKLDNPNTPNIMSYIIIISDQNDKNRTAIMPATLSPRKKEEAYSWWLRSPGEADIKAALIGNKGNIWMGGELIWAKQSSKFKGIRPALWLKV